MAGHLLPSQLFLGWASDDFLRLIVVPALPGRKLLVALMNGCAGLGATVSPHEARKAPITSNIETEDENTPTSASLVIPA
jgi:hypothetical protein